MIEAPDPVVLAEIILLHLEEMSIELRKCHHLEALEKNENKIEYIRSWLWISAHEGMETKPIEVEE